MGVPNSYQMINMPSLDDMDDHDHHISEDDRVVTVHLPLHVQLMERPVLSVISNDENSECTNPHLRRLMERYFPSDDEDIDCGCDADNESIPSHVEKTPRTKRRGSRRRRRSSCLDLDFLDTANPNHNKILPTIDLGVFHKHMNMEVNALSLKAKSCDAIVQQGDFKEASWSDDEEKDRGDVRMTTLNTFSRFNAWDSSPSTVCEEDVANISYNQFFNPIDSEEGNNHHSFHDSNVRKNLFANDSGDDLDLSTDHNLSATLVDTDPEQPALDGLDTNDSDLELTQRSRQLQYDLRLQEMTELALEAERAAEAGKEKFVGSATKFELGLGLDAGTVEDCLKECSPPRTLDRFRNGIPAWSSCRPFGCGRPMQEDIATPQRAHTTKQRHILGRRPVTELSKQRPKPVSARLRQLSAPPTLQYHQALIAPPISSIPSILTSRTFLSSPPAVKKEKIPVLALRHIEDIIPSFQSIHPHLRTHMTKCGVKHDMLSPIDRTSETRDTDGINHRPSSDDPLSRGLKGTGSISGASFLTRVPSFHRIMKSVSGLSGSDLVARHTSDDDLSFDGSKVSKDSDTNLSIESVIPMDCVSFVSCGERSDKMVALTPVRPPKRPPIIDVIDHDKSIPRDRSSDIYACTLATELHDPRQERRPVSPPPEAPYNMNVDLLDLSPRRGASFCARTPRSRWSTFWENISPTKRHLSLPGKLSLGAPYLPSITSKQSQSSEVINGGKPAFLPLGDDNEKPFYLRPLGTTTMDDWDTQDDDNRNNVLSYPKPVAPCAQPPSFYPKSSSEINVHTDINTHRERPINDDVCVKGHCHKESFRTSTTSHLSGDDESFSDLSQVSKTSKPIIPSSLTVYNVTSLEEATLGNNDALQPESTSTNPFVTRDQDSASDKPPLYPAGAKLANILLNKTSSFRKAKKEMLPDLPSIEVFHNDIVDNYVAEVVDKTDQPYGESSQKITESNDFNLKSIDLKEKKSDTDMSYDSENLSKTSMGYDLRNHVCDRDGRSLCEGPADRIPRKGLTKSQSTISLDAILGGDNMNSKSFPDDEDTNNKSTLSFINLIEKVPSVIGRLRFGKSKDSGGTYRDDLEFVENYLYTGKKEKKSKTICENEDNICRRKEYCGKNPKCIDMNCSSVVESAITCLSVQHSVSYELPYDEPVTLRDSQNRVANSFGLKEKLKQGDFVFKGPSLKFKTQGEMPLNSRSVESSSSIAE